VIFLVAAKIGELDKKQLICFSVNIKLKIWSSQAEAMKSG
jgi:hypothetical protein